MSALSEHAGRRSPAFDAAGLATAASFQVLSALSARGARSPAF
jgi:hypothetical protein